MIERILCPFHTERTPSCVVYPTGFKCYGCGRTGTLQDLGRSEAPKIKETYVEDIKSSIERIKTLSVRNIRGIDLPCDSEYYYIVYPTGDYYNARRIDSSASHVQKYKCPAGIRRPLFHALDVPSAVCIVCEGEINAISISQAYPEVACVSPGGSSDFYGKRLLKDLTHYKKYDRIIVVTDEDKAGCIAAIQLKTHLTPIVPDVDIFLMPIDANDILVKYGKEALKEVVKNMVVSRRLCLDFKGLPAS